ncbi:helix-turn-helix transcriptional regulator [Plantactinospora sp. WMMB334]|uniref:helix-turn-helix transcriptional regulator n=1 Tax=Plantactinospora sp. WMMB334 TaxID=3404119 RepID=UPI003B94E6B6
MPEVPGPLVGPAEIQAMLGVGRSRMRQIVNQRNFPEPFQTLIGGSVWLRKDVEAWITKHRRPRPATSGDDDESA